MTIARPSTAPSQRIPNDPAYPKAADILSEASRTSLLEPRATRPIRTLLGDIYPIPNTDTTLIIEWEDRSYRHPIIPAIRQLLDHALTEVESIIDIAGSGTIPGPRNEYLLQLIFTDVPDGPVVGSLVIRGEWNPWDLRQELTYVIARDVLRGLWDLIVVPRRETELHSLYVVHQGHVVAMVILAFAWD
ncbi:MAG: hypothetical protein Q9224_006734 [Gallowayella concinna]